YAAVIHYNAARCQPSQQFGGELGERQRHDRSVVFPIAAGPVLPHLSVGSITSGMQIENQAWAAFEIGERHPVAVPHHRLNLVLGDPADAILVAEMEALHVHGLDDAGDGQEPVVSNQWMIASQVVLAVHHSQILPEAIRQRRSNPALQGVNRVRVGGWIHTGKNARRKCCDLADDFCPHNDDDVYLSILRHLVDLADPSRDRDTRRTRRNPELPNVAGTIRYARTLSCRLLFFRASLLRRRESGNGTSATSAMDAPESAFGGILLQKSFEHLGGQNWF